METVMDKINARDYYAMLTYAASSLTEKAEEVNALNVFPVPDGDTGSNMSMTVSGVSGITEEMLNSVGSVSSSAADLMLRSARGNSGVILSVYFRGFASELAELEAATVRDLVKAFASGVSPLGFLMI